MNDFTQLRPSNLRDQALSIIRARVISGSFKPGTVYSAAAVASELGVSSGPVREAMLALVQQGMMEVARNKGFRVLELSARDRKDIAELRTLLETPSMVRLAGSADVKAAEPKFRALADEIVAAAKQDDLVEYLRADREFHLGLTSLLGNERLTDSIGSLRDLTRQFGLQALAEEGRIVASAEEHHQILDALIAGDPAEVQLLMEKHLRHLTSGWSAPELEPR